MSEPKGFWAWSLDEETFGGCEETREEAMGMAFEEINYKPDVTVWTGRAAPFEDVRLAHWHRIVTGHGDEHRQEWTDA